MDKISIIITTYGGSSKLARAIESAQNQSYDEIEIIIVDDNNPNTFERLKTEEIMKNYIDDERIVYIKHDRNYNGAKARNSGIEKATGNFISFLDDDDYYLKNRMEKCIEALKANPEYDCVYSNVVYIMGKKIIDTLTVNERTIKLEDLLIDEKMLGTGSNIFIRTKICKYLGGFDELFSRHQDLEFMLRVLRNSKLLALPEYLIVKDLSDRGLPSYLKFKKAKIKYFNKFEKDIKNLKDDTRNSFYDYHYSILYKSALASGKKCYVIEASNDLEQIRLLTKFEEFSSKYYYIVYKWYLIKRFLRKKQWLLQLVTKIKQKSRANIDIDLLAEVNSIMSSY